MVLLITADWLSNNRLIAGYIKDIICNLEGQTKIIRIFGQGRQLDSTRSTKNCSTADSSPEQCPRLAHMHTAQR